MKIPMNLRATDLSKLGGAGTSKGDNENETVFICSSETCCIESIMIRNIIEHLGYEVLEETDFVWNIEGQPEEHIDLRVLTSLPWKEYQKITSGKY